MLGDGCSFFNETTRACAAIQSVGSHGTSPALTGRPGNREADPGGTAGLPTHFTDDGADGKSVIIIMTRRRVVSRDTDGPGAAWPGLEASRPETPQWHVIPHRSMGGRGEPEPAWAGTGGGTDRDRQTHRQAGPGNGEESTDSSGCC